MKKRIAFPIVKVTTKVVVLKQVKVKAYTRTHCFPPWFFITLPYNRDSKDFDITSKAFDETLSAWN